MRATVSTRSVLFRHQNGVHQLKLRGFIQRDDFAALLSIDHQLKTRSANIRRVLGDCGGHLSGFDHFARFRNAVGTDYQYLAGFAGIRDGLGDAHCHGVVGAVDRFNVRVTLQHVGGDVQRLDAVPVGRLTGNQLDLTRFFESFGGAIAAGLTGRVTGFAFDNSDFAAFSTQFVDDKLCAFRPDRHVIGGDKTFYVAAGFLQVIHIDFFIEVDQIDALFPGFSHRHHQVYR